MKLEIGEIITLDNGEEYMVLTRETYKNKDYLYLIFVKKPVVIKIVEEEINNEEVSVITVEDPEILKGLLQQNKI